MWIGCLSSIEFFVRIMSYMIQVTVTFPFLLFQVDTSSTSLAIEGCTIDGSSSDVSGLTPSNVENTESSESTLRQTGKLLDKLQCDGFLSYSLCLLDSVGNMNSCSAA